ncbi:hypothetical protein [Lonsdalea quercina]|uniref:hypothetical protein n=1 Tax=Lonsdalea quercina TaxID=71657 RepID=UPI003975BCA7
MKTNPHALESLHLLNFLCFQMVGKDQLRHTAADLKTVSFFNIFIKQAMSAFARISPKLPTSRTVPYPTRKKKRLPNFGKRQ